MLSADGAADESACQIVPLPTRSIRKQRHTRIREMLNRLDAAQAAGEQDIAEALIAAIYERCDAARMSNRRDGLTA